MTNTLTQRLRRLLVLVAAAIALTALTGSGASGAGSTAAFDWSMPPRTGIDANGDGVVEARDTPAEVDPANWHVDFDACASTGSVETYRWTIDGAAAGEATSCDGFSHNFGDEGTYEVTLTTTDADGDQVSVSKDVVVQDFLVLALGDSYGSGEGNPDVPIPGFRFTDTERAYEDLQDAIARLATVQLDYDRTVDAADRVLARLHDVNAALGDMARFCDPLSGEASIELCADATARFADASVQLTAALAAFGLEALSDTLDLIQQKMADLVAAADAALTLARNAMSDARNAFDNLEAALSPDWQNERCHRSARSGQARAAKRLEDLDPHTSVTLVHLSCSGGGILAGVIGPYKGAVQPPGAADLPPQVDKALALIGDREIDGLVMSIGGNDAEFGPIVESCLALDPCHIPPTVVSSLTSTVALLCAPFEFILGRCSQYWTDVGARAPFAKSGLELFTSGIGDLPRRYDRLDDRLREAFPDLPPEHVYLTEYPNVTEDDDGTPCQTEPPDLLASIPGFSLAETTWARDVVTNGLDDAVEAGAVDHDWTFVGGTFDAFGGHGYCADDHWVVRFQDTFPSQGDYMGAVHPNASGQTVYRDLILAALQADLYAGGDLSQPRRPQQPPTADAGGPYVLDEGSTIGLDNGSFDRNGDALTFSWTLDPGFLGKAALSDAHATEPVLSASDDASGVVRLVASDGRSSGSDDASVTIRNVAPSVAAGADRTITEGGALSLSVPVTDPGSDALTARIDWGQGGGLEPATIAAGRVTGSHVYADEGSFAVTVRVADDDGGVGTDSIQLAVANALPAVGPITAPVDPVPVGTTVNASASFSDAGTSDTHTALWNWDDGTTSAGTLVESAGAGRASAARTFTAPGVYELRLTVSDNDGGSATASFRYVVVFDPEGGFVTGAGSIDSPAGAYRPDPTLTGKASFGFQSKYQKGAAPPTGKTQFQFKAGSLDFDSTAYQWLVVAGKKAQFKGTGALNGAGGYGFLLTAWDGGTGPGSDRFRIKVWLVSTGAIVYDNALGNSDDIDNANPQTVTTGSIVVHK